jgi:hypothetical protein
MREIISVQVGQCGNQIGNMVRLILIVIFLNINIYI